MRRLGAYVAVGSVEAFTTNATRSRAIRTWPTSCYCPEVRDGITSIKDEHIVLARALATRTGRQEHGRCLLEGPALIAQAVTAGATVEFALHAEGQPDGLSDLLRANEIPVFDARESLLRQAIRSQRAVGWLAVAVLPPSDGNAAEYGDFAVVLDNVLDPGNLGSIVRTACGLGAPDVICTDPETDLTSRRVIDASRSAVLRARIRHFATPLAAVDSLRANGFDIVATSPRGQTVQSLTGLSGRPVALIVGNETDGVGEEVLAAADLVVRIPMAGDVESLNVSVATGISMYELRTRMLFTALAQRAGSALIAEVDEAAAALRGALDRGIAAPNGPSVAEDLDVRLAAAAQDVQSAALAGFAPAEINQLTDYLARLTRNLAPRE